MDDQSLDPGVDPSPLPSVTPSDTSGKPYVASTAGGEPTANPSMADNAWVGVTSAARLGWQSEAMHWIRDKLEPAEPGFNPLDPGLVKQLRDEGRMGLLPDLATTRSLPEWNRVLERHKDQDRLAEAVSQQGNFWTSMAAMVADPVTYLPLPGMAGKGVLRAAAEMGGINAATGLATGVVHSMLDSTHDVREDIAAMKYSFAFGALLGGAHAAMSARVPQIARDFMRENQRLDESLGQRSPERPVPEGEARFDPAGEAQAAAGGGGESPPTQAGVSHETGATPALGEDGILSAEVKPFEVKPTDGADVGIAPAGGLEKVIGQSTVLGRMVQTGIQSVSDFAQSLAGDFGFKTKDNLRGIASPDSALLRSRRWVAMATDASAELERIYNQYLGHGDGLSVGGLNVTGSAERVRNAALQVVGKQRGDGKVMFDDFQRAIMEAHRSDKLEVPASIPEDLKPYVEKALPVVRAFFDRARLEGVRSGAIPSKEGFRRQVQALTERHNKLEDAYAELDRNPSRSAGETIAMENIGDELIRLRDRMGNIDLSTVAATDEKLSGIIDDIMTKGQARLASAQNVAQKIRAQIATRYEAMIATRGHLLQVQDERGLTPAQQKYLDYLNEHIGTPDKPGPVLDHLSGMLTDEIGAIPANDNALIHTPGVEPYSAKDPRFDPPANDHGVTVDKWEDRKAALKPDVDWPQRVARVQDWIRSNISDAAAQGFARDVADGMILPHELSLAAEEHFERVSWKQINEIFAEHHPDASPDDLKVMRQTVALDLLGADPGEEHGIRTLFGDVTPTTQKLLAIHNEFARKTKEIQQLAEAELKLPDYQTGKPTVVDGFHGSKISWIADPNAHFANDALGSQTPAMSSNEGFFFARNPETSHTYSANADGTEPQFFNSILQSMHAGGQAPNMIMARVRLDNPFVYDFKGSHYREETYFDLMRKAKADGHDGVIFLNTYDGGPKDVIYAAFNPENIRYRFKPGEVSTPAHEVFGRPDMQGVANDVRERAPSDPRALEPGAPANDAGTPEFATDAETAALGKLDDIAAKGGLTDSQKSYMQVLLNKVMRGDIDYSGPPGEAYYLPRHWNRERVLQDQAGPNRLPQILAEHFAEQDGTAAGEQMSRAHRAIAAILSSTEADGPHFDGDLVTRKFVSSFLARKLDIANEKVLDFIDTNVGNLMREYAHSAGVSIEFAKQFGDRMAESSLADTLIQAARESKIAEPEAARAQLTGIGNDLTFLRDATLQRLRAGDPLTLTQVGVRTAKLWTAMAALGNVAITALGEVFRPLMTRGITDNFGFLFHTFLGDRSLIEGVNKPLRQLTGELLDVAHGNYGARYMDMGGIAGRPGSQAAELARRITDPLNNFAESHFYVLNGLAHVTDFLKSYAQAASAHFMLEDILAVAGGTASDRTISNLAAYGIDAESAKLMASQPIIQGKRARFANLSEWTDPILVSKFANAVAGEVRRTIVTPSVGDKSMIQQGFTHFAGDKRREFALVTLPFQFLSWGIAANQKVLLSALQGRDANALGGAVALVGVGYLVNALKTPSGTWENMSLADRIALSVDSSGVLASAGDLNNLIETGSRNTFGARPALGLQPKYNRPTTDNDQIAMPFGPAGSKAMDVYDAFTNPYMTADRQAGTIRRSVPLNGLFYMQGLMRGVGMPGY